ncbi:S8/S53 family peptidase, partial [Sphingomonas sp. AR_OL41]|uniref:S8/S53 family peptidase n=1 Tax=Sphingomonas sp. AR_OL41 TaxID=3042729 RepID=UPI002481256E
MAIRSGVSLLVKAQEIGVTGRLAMGATTATFAAKPIMPHLREHQAGLGLTDAAAQWYQVEVEGDAASTWEACHAMLRHGLGVAGGPGVIFAEPDFTTRWPTDADRPPEAMALAASCDAAAPQDSRFPREPEDLWYRDPAHGGFEAAIAALDAIPPAKRSTIRVAHLDTGYDPSHAALPAGLRRDLQRNFVAGEDERDATDEVHGPLTNRGHGTGTMSVLAGRDPTDPHRTVGAAPFVEVVPIRVANRVVLFSNSSVARALDYVLSLKDTPDRIDVVTMSMGGLASQAWAEGVNALYEAGIFVVTAAGNNFANLPTRNIVFPARFNRVVAACGIMANGTPYADLAPRLMAGNYGPASKMTTAIAASTPNLPWARLGCEKIVDHDGCGTSAATPQVAAAASIWLAAHRKEARYAEPWMLVEAVRAALFGSARAADQVHCGRGSIDAAKMVGVKPAAATALVKQPVDKADFAFLRVLLGVGVAAPDRQQQAMLELEALQLSQSAAIEQILPDPDDPSPDPARRAALTAALAADPRASRALRAV